MRAGGQVVRARLPVIGSLAVLELLCAVDKEPADIPAGAFALRGIVEGDRARLGQRDVQRQRGGGVAFSAVSGLGVDSVALGDNLPRVGFVILKAQACAHGGIRDGKRGLLLAFMLGQVVGGDDNGSGCDAEFAHAVFMAVQRHQCGIGAHVLRLGNLHIVLIECDRGDGKAVFFSPEIGVGVRRGVLAVVRFVCRFGMHRHSAVGAAPNATGGGINVGSLVVSHSPVMHVLPLGVEGGVFQDFKLVAALVSVAGAVRLGVPAVKDQIRLGKAVAVGQLYLALHVVFAAAGDASLSAVGVKGHVVARVGTEHVADLPDENRHPFPFVHIENHTKVAALHHGKAGTELDGAALVFISLREHDEAAILVLFAVFENPQKCVKLRAGIHAAAQLFPVVDANESGVRLELHAAGARDVNLAASACNNAL